MSDEELSRLDPDVTIATLKRIGNAYDEAFRAAEVKSTLFRTLEDALDVGLDFEPDHRAACGNIELTRRQHVNELNVAKRVKSTPESVFVDIDRDLTDKELRTLRDTVVFDTHPDSTIQPAVNNAERESSITERNG